MNYVYLFLTFALLTIMLSLGLLYMSPFIVKDLVSFLEVCIGIGVTACFITIIVAVINNMNITQEFNEQLNCVIESKTKLTIHKESLESLKDEFKLIMTKSYPEYESEIFSKINPEDTQNLSILFTKYPELKYSAIMNSYVDIIHKKINCITEIRTNIACNLRQARDISQDRWSFYNKSFKKSLDTFIDSQDL